MPTLCRYSEICEKLWKEKKNSLSNSRVIFNSTVKDKPMSKNKTTLYKGVNLHQARESIKPHYSAFGSCLSQLIALEM